MSKDWYIEAHEREIADYLDRHPNASEAEAYDRTADRAYDREGMAAKLAGIVADLINANEPLLKAISAGTDITVIERGSPMVFSINVQPDSNEGAGAVQAAPGE